MDINTQWLIYRACLESRLNATSGPLNESGWGRTHSNHSCLEHVGVEAMGSPGGPSDSPDKIIRDAITYYLMGVAGVTVCIVEAAFIFIVL